MSELQLAQVIDELKASRKELKQIRMILEDISARDARMEDAMNKQREFSSTAVMEAMKSMGAVTGDNPSALNDMFRKMALDKEDEKGV